MAFSIVAALFAAAASNASVPIAGPQDWAIPISPQLRSASLAGGVPDTPRRYRLLCAVWYDDGQARRCVEAPTEVPPNILEFVRLGEADPAAATDPYLAVAVRRILSARFERRPPGKVSGYIWLLVDETVSPDDRLADPAGGGEPLPRTVVSVGGSFGEAATALYPSIALRNESQARVVLKCWIMEANRLDCRSGDVLYTDDPYISATHNRAIREQFLLASIQLSTTLVVSSKPGAPADLTGKRIDVPINWLLPG